MACSLLNTDLPFQIRDISVGGFSISTTTSLEPGSHHRARFSAAGDWSTVLDARVANLRPMIASDGAPTFVVGFAFTPQMARPTIGQRLRQSWLTLRYMPRLLTQPWQATWVEALIDDRLGRTSTARMLVERARLAL